MSVVPRSEASPIAKMYFASGATELPPVGDEIKGISRRPYSQTPRYASGAAKKEIKSPEDAKAFFHEIRTHAGALNRRPMTPSPGEAKKRGLDWA